MPVPQERFRKDFKIFWDGFLKPWSEGAEIEDQLSLETLADDGEDEIGKALYGCTVMMPWMTPQPSYIEARTVYNKLFLLIDKIYETASKEDRQKACDDFYGFAIDNIAKKSFATDFVWMITNIFNEYIFEDAS